MTSLQLLFWITGGLALQVAIYLGISFTRHWQNYTSLQCRAAELPPPPTEIPRPETNKHTAASWQGFRAFRVERKILEDTTRTVSSLYLIPEDGHPLPAFMPGQFLTLRLEIPSAGGATEQLVRCYSLSEAPHPNHYRISVKRVLAPSGSSLPPGRASNFIHDQVGVGSLLQVRAPSGHFYLERSDTPVVLIGGGIGITPMLSMLNWSLTEQPGREIWLFYGIRQGTELVMAAYLEALAATHQNFHLRLCFSAPLPEDRAGEAGRIQGRIEVPLLRMELPLKPYHFYICGPTPMMESLVVALEDWGVPDNRIHFEAFGPASIKRRNSPATLADHSPSQLTETSPQVTFTKSGKQLAWQADSGNLLEFAEANGINVDSGCRAGGCGSCQTTLRSGEVTYLQPPDYDPEPGTCLLCVCVPKTPVTLEA